MNPLLYRGILYLIGVGLVSALIAVSLLVLPYTLHTPALAFIAGMFGTAIIIVICLYRTGSTKLEFLFKDNSPGGCLEIIALLFLWCIPYVIGYGDVVWFCLFGSLIVGLISRYAVGEFKK